MPPPPTSTPPTRPATISELATAAASTAAEPSPSTDLKNLLRRADAHRRAGGAYMARANSPNPTNPSGPGADSAVMVGLNLERAFIEYARAATLIVETIPGHREYGAGLTAEQRTNLTANGEDILHNLGRLKAALVERYERYMRGPGARTDAIPAFMVAQQQQAAASTIPSTQPIRRPSQHTQAHAQVHARAQQTVADEAAQWRVQREESIRRDAAAGLASAGAYASSASTFARGAGAAAPGGPTPTYLSSASQAAVAAATRAANTDGGGPQPAAVPVSLASAASQHQQGGQAQLSAIPASFGSGNNGGSYAYPSSAGVSFPHPQVQTQTTGGSYAPSYTSNTSGSPSTYTAPSSSSVSTTYPTTLGTPQSIAYTHSNASSMHSTTPYPGPMPLRPPGASSYDWEWDSASGTDDDRPPPHSHPPISYPGAGVPFPAPNASSSYSPSYTRNEAPRGGGGGQGVEGLERGMGRLGVGSDAPIDGLPSSPAHASTVAYPSLARHMSSHQRTQGYVPGAWGSALPPAVPAFATLAEGSTSAAPSYEAYAQAQGARDAGQGQGGGGYGRGPGQDGNLAGVGASNGWQPPAHPQTQAALGAARAAAVAPPTTVQYSTAFSPPADPRGAAREKEKAAREAAAREAAAEARRGEQEDMERERERRKNGGKPRLRTVLLPHATLPRFLAIASGNTARNLETCGLLLGREVSKGESGASASGSGSGGKTRYVVSTLLIPKQHATSDTCTMDEEEGVLGFTEERGLITLGWIHTHPSQSCFMSSVDLHTHASFQCMLPESFAVVCAPKSDPNFGIFRLTDPPGLQTVLKCTAKQAFHPHPDVPIYTDADKGHVQMRDAALEIVDLR